MTRCRAVWAVVLIGMAGCQPQPERTEMLVFAAASLTDALADMEHQFEAMHPGVDVIVSVGASSLLARQIERGAPADMFLSASPVWTDHLADMGALRSSSEPVVGNRLVVIGRHEAEPLRTLDELQRFDRLALADAGVPAGDYAREGLTQAGLWDDLADRVVPALDVRAVMAAVQMGAAPVGIVYASDVPLGSDVRVLLHWPEAFAPSIHYQAAVPITAQHLAQAEAFVAFIRDPARAPVWQRFGFEPLGEAQPEAQP